MQTHLKHQKSSDYDTATFYLVFFSSNGDCVAQYNLGLLIVLRFQLHVVRRLDLSNCCFPPRYERYHRDDFELSHENIGIIEMSNRYGFFLPDPRPDVKPVSEEP